jgi:PQQ-dependent catabolism-associated CXXCW motif protein
MSPPVTAARREPERRTPDGAKTHGVPPPQAREASFRGLVTRCRSACRHVRSSRRGMTVPYLTFVLALAIVRAPATAAPISAKSNVAAPEPSGYWTGPINSAVPLTISGGTVLRHARQLRALMRQGGAIVVDVSNAAHRPENLAPGAPWLPLPHRAIPGSLWIPGVGLGEIPVSVDDFYRQRLAAASGAHLARPLVIYCHRSCWLSWNAAKRAISYGYSKVYWFRDGVEGWKAAGYRTAVVEPQLAPEG